VDGDYTRSDAFLSFTLIESFESYTRWAEARWAEGESYTRSDAFLSLTLIESYTVLADGEFYTRFDAGLINCW
jgi:hypothetical protein